MEYGLVLGGGGTMGSYEIGVWKALREIDVTITAVSGTSIGAINGAIIAQNDLEWAIDFWTNIKIDDVFLVDKDTLEKYNADSSKLDFRSLLNTFRTLILNGGLDITPLKENLNTYISEDQIRKSPIKLGLVTVSLTDLKPVELMIDEIPEGKLIDYLLASAALPAFQKHEIDGSVFIDGGFYDNLPVQLLANNGYKNFIAVSLPSLGVVSRLKLQDIDIIAIEPSDELGGTLDFTPNLMSRNIQLGYLDTLKKFGQLDGTSYYINLKGSNKTYQRFIEKLGTPLKDEADAKLPLLLGVESIASKEDFWEAARNLLSHTTYKGENLPLNLLEITADTLNVERLKVYNPSEFIHEILLRVDHLLQKNIELIENYDHVSDMIKSAGELAISPLSNIKFISYYLYIINMEPDAIGPMAKFITRLAPETVLSIVTLMYLF